VRQVGQLPRSPSTCSEP